MCFLYILKSMSDGRSKNEDICFTFLVSVFGLFFKNCSWFKVFKDLKGFSLLFEIHINLLNVLEIKVLIWKFIFINYCISESVLKCEWPILKIYIKLRHTSSLRETEADKGSSF